MSVVFLLGIVVASRAQRVCTRNRPRVTADNSGSSTSGGPSAQTHIQTQHPLQLHVRERNQVPVDELKLYIYKIMEWSMK